MNKELSAETNLSHYRILRKIGAGGMGEIYPFIDSLRDDLRFQELLENWFTALEFSSFQAVLYR